jgi:hypothetical protein
MHALPASRHDSDDDVDLLDYLDRAFRDELTETELEGIRRRAQEERKARKQPDPAVPPRATASEICRKFERPTSRSSAGFTCFRA